MESISTGLGDFLESLDADKARLFKIAEHNRRFEAAVRRTWGDSPDAADYILAHVNSLFFAKDDAPRKGAAKGRDEFFLGLYVDDSLASAEVNARREMLQLSLLQDGFRIAEVRIFASKLGMKERHAFPDAVARVNALLYSAPADADAEVDDEREAARDGERGFTLRVEDESKLLETFKRAVCLALGDIDHAQAVLGRVEGAALEEATFDAQKRRGQARWRVRLYAADPDPLREVMRAFGPAVASRARGLGLHVASIDVMESPARLAGESAFPPAGAPRPLQSYRLELGGDGA